MARGALAIFPQKGVVHEIERTLVTPDNPQDLQKLRDVAAVVNA